MGLFLGLLGGMLLLVPPQHVWSRANYKKWLKQEVPWIISRQEARAFKSLKSDAERDEFIERFWERRDPTPSTERNEYKEAYYRRLRFVNRTFQEGIPGWKTDRGRIYLIHGPPDSQSFFTSRSRISPTRRLAPTERNPSTFLWTYHHNRYARYYKGEIRLVFQPSTGLTRQDLALDESLTSQQKADELSRRFFPASDPNWLEGDVRYRLVAAGPPALVNASGAELPRAAGGELARYIEDLFRSPGEWLEEQEQRAARREASRRELRRSVKSHVSFGRLPFHLSSQAFYRPHAEWLIEVDVGVDPAPLAESRCDLYVALVDRQGEIFDEFLDTLESDAAHGRAPIRYTNSFSAPAGEYTLKAVLREPESGKTGFQQQDLRLAEDAPSRVELTSMRLTNRARMLADPHKDGPPAPAGSLGYQRALLLASPERRFAQSDRLILYFQLRVPPDHGQISINGNFIRQGSIVKRLAPRLLEAGKDSFLAYATVVPLSGLPPGEYIFQAQVLDHLRHTFDIRRTTFTVSQ